MEKNSFIALRYRAYSRASYNYVYAIIELQYRRKFYSQDHCTNLYIPNNTVFLRMVLG